MQGKLGSSEADVGALSQPTDAIVKTIEAPMAVLFIFCVTYVGCGTATQASHRDGYSSVGGFAQGQ